MSAVQINIINLPHRCDRLENAILQSYEHGFKCRIWDGLIMQDKITAVSCAHKQIVAYAKFSRRDYVMIGEDDLSFTASGALDYYLSNMPNEYDIYLAGISGGEIDEGGNARFWSGMFCYCVHERFYDAFLDAPDGVNIDRWLSTTGIDAIAAKLGRNPVYKVCDPIACITIDGVSDLRMGYVEHSANFLPYRKFHG